MLDYHHQSRAAANLPKALVQFPGPMCCEAERQSRAARQKRSEETTLSDYCAGAIPASYQPGSRVHVLIQNPPEEGIDGG